MRTLVVTRAEAGDLRRAYAPTPTGQDAEHVLAGDVRLVDEAGETVAVQLLAAADLTASLARLLRTAKWEDTRANKAKSEARLSGIASANMTFGGLPPVPLRKRYGCSRCAVHRTHPDVAAGLDGAGDRVWEAFERFAPEAAQRTLELVNAKGIPNAWRLGESPWTSGVANNNAALPYHRDAGNVKGAWSGMLGLKRHCEGGYLHLADFGVWLTIPDGSVTLFNGGQVTHGVTPFRLTHPGGWRFTVVWYARSGMCVCAPDPADEPARAARQATLYAERKIERAR